MSKHIPEDIILETMEGRAVEAFNNPREIQVDVERYQALLDHPDLSDEQRREILEALWLLVMTFVDLGFSVHPVQKACGQVSENGSEGAEDDGHESMMEPE